MEMRMLDPDLSISPQIQVDDLPALQLAGIRAIICNRPDGEGPDPQPSFSQIAQEARRLGIEARYLPTIPNDVTDELGAAFGHLMDALPKPVLGYCRTGRRSATMWALSQAGRQSPKAILETTAKAGHDLASLTPRLDSPPHRKT